MTYRPGLEPVGGVTIHLHCCEQCGMSIPCAHDHDGKLGRPEPSRCVRCEAEDDIDTSG